LKHSLQQLLKLGAKSPRVNMVVALCWGPLLLAAPHLVTWYTPELVTLLLSGGSGQGGAGCELELSVSGHRVAHHNVLWVAVLWRLTPLPVSPAPIVCQSTTTPCCCVGWPPSSSGPPPYPSMPGCPPRSPLLHLADLTDSVSPDPLPLLLMSPPAW
jgi:hypothetical protein